MRGGACLQTTVKQTNNSASYKKTTRRNAGGHICLEIRVIETMVRHCAFCKLKVLRATTLARARMEHNIYIYFFLFGLKRARAFR